MFLNLLMNTCILKNHVLNWIKTKITAYFECLALLMIVIKVESHLSILEIPIIKNHFFVFEKMRMYL